jgi:hypothetical protein
MLRFLCFSLVLFVLNIEHRRRFERGWAAAAADYATAAVTAGGSVAGGSSQSWSNGHVCP